MGNEQQMVQERFALLARTYGGDLRRWPAAERAAADALLARNQAVSRAVLARETRLDGRLDAYFVPTPSAALVGRILAAAPQPALLWSRARLWWSGLGFAGVGLAGALTGALALSLAAPAPFDHGAASWAEGQTIFGEVDVYGILDE